MELCVLKDNTHTHTDTQRHTYRFLSFVPPARPGFPGPLAGGELRRGWVPGPPIWILGDCSQGWVLGPQSLPGTILPSGFTTESRLEPHPLFPILVERLPPLRKLVGDII